MTKNIFTSQSKKRSCFSKLFGKKSKDNKDDKNDVELYTDKVNYEFYYDVDLEKPKLVKLPKHMSIVNPNLKNNPNYKHVQYFDIDLKKERNTFIPKHVNILPYEIQEDHKTQITQTSSTWSSFTISDSEEKSVNDKINFFEKSNYPTPSLFTILDEESHDISDIISDIIDTYIYDEYYKDNLNYSNCSDFSEYS